MEAERQYEPCQVCQDSASTRHHFGITSCTACASFFRRTTMNQFTCNLDNNCSVSYKKKWVCRACRYNNCIRAGMSKDYIRRGNVDETKNRKTFRKRTIRNSIRRNKSSLNRISEPVKMDQNSTSRSSTSSSIKHSSDTSTEFSKILHLSNDELLQFYLKEVERTMVQKQRGLAKNALLAESMNELMIISAYQNGLSMESCMHCPGVNSLEKEDVQTLLKYFQFANVWMDSVRAYSMSNVDIYETTPKDKRLSEYIQQVKLTLGSSFSQLKLNLYEFAALKSYCIWNMGFFETSIAMKIIAREHYIGVTAALRNYYRTQTKMSDMDIAIRIGDITLQIITVSNMFHDMAKLSYQCGLTF
ncbi:Nuclear Hormone Receptor family [Caenorhabditis elegans]|uniref:Nuclear Hormone Receptor family n=1 Tax=Caenorhabditis elegans TaxID=6239 RepID=Q19438_CAEEL|nr:Nuclear Hormone Receptor family [Caenorhabditis elegans]CAB00091.3 Nuclear Hormone Receptor family [Caenorhabditis elegans]|eukprot:NP_501622.3 Nuclear Hormone Receptor family [Caenorhabditis elegans]